MWMIRPSVLREVTIDLPEVLVESLGVGAEMLAHYLQSRGPRQDKQTVVLKQGICSSGSGERSNARVNGW